ncbi:MAG: hypothetical protein ACKO6F_01125 [Cyanobium sp.]
MAAIQHPWPLSVPPSTRSARLLPLSLGLTLLLSGCVPAAQRSSGRVFPLPRHRPHDGLAVVTRPGGTGLHLYLETDTGAPGVCTPRWNPETARLRGGDGPTPGSNGRAPQAEFFEAVGRGQVRWALRRELAALCRARAPGRRFVWSEPPRSAAAVRLPELPLLEGPHLLSHPTVVRRAEKQLLGQPLTPDDLVDKPLPRPPDGP